MSTPCRSVRWDDWPREALGGSGHDCSPTSRQANGQFPHEHTAAQLDIWRIELARVEGARAVLDEQERARADRFVVERPAWQFTRARAALRRILARRLGSTAEELDFVAGAHGKPALGAGNVSFNLSHSAGWAVVVVGDRRWGSSLGIDVEEVSSTRPLDRLAARFFAAEELALYQRTAPIQRVRLFFRLWALKESYVKALGTGLTYSSRRFALAFERGDPAAGDLESPRMLHCEKQLQGEAEAGWRFLEFAPHRSMQGALCWPDSSQKPRLRFRDYAESFNADRCRR